MFDASYAPSQAARRNGLLTCADLFCGIGGFHIAAANLGVNVVFACDIDEATQRAYKHNFGTWAASRPSTLVWTGVGGRNRCHANRKAD
jgi:site-specific DNA-cytosine methylase